MRARPRRLGYLARESSRDCVISVLPSFYSAMRPLNASECISPAIARTKLVLFTPFRKGRTWKLAATAYLCRAGTMCFPFPLIYLLFLPLAEHAGRLAVVLLVAGVLVATAVAVVLFYLCSRLQFAFFDIVVNRGEFVAPAWRKYGPQSLPWTGVKLLFGALATLACAAPIAAFTRHIIPLFQEMGSMAPGQPPSPQVMKVMLGFYAGYAVLLLVFGSLFLISSLFSDFIVPSLALEDTGLPEAFRRMFELVRREPGEFTLYALLKVGLAIAVYIGVTIAWEIVLILSTVIVGIVVFLLGFLLHLAGVPAAVLTALGIVVAIAWYLFFFIYTLFFAIGAVFTFLDAYALYFLAGRYPMLGDLLDRSTPPPSFAYPASFPPPYYPPQAAPPPPPSPLS